MVILYIVFLVPLTLGAYHKAEYGQFCSDSNTRIRNQYTCQVAAHALGLPWGHAFWGRNDFPGCLHTKDPRNKVYFNLDPHPANDPNNPDYAEICTGEGPETGSLVVGDGGETTDRWLVLTGGHHENHLRTSEIVTSSGVCNPNNGYPDGGDFDDPTYIPLLPHPRSAGQMTFMTVQSDNLLIFCGGSAANLVSTNLCFSLTIEPGGQWSESTVPGMRQPRSMFTLTKINDNEMIAVGGIDQFGVTSGLMEKYSFTTGQWTYLTPVLQPRCGHCTIGQNSYLTVIGGSASGPQSGSWTALNTVYKVEIDSTVTNQPPLPKPLFGPACITKRGGNIIVSGGLTGDNNSPQASDRVYEFDIAMNSWSTLNGRLNLPRSFHVMGTLGTRDNPNGKWSVAGGYRPDEYLSSVEDSISIGFNWTPRRTDLLTGREYAAAAEVPANMFTCLG